MSSTQPGHVPGQMRRALPRSTTVRRDALIERLGARFDVRLTTLVAGAGAGKTTVLAQALELDDDHADVWYPCSIADRDPGRLVGTLAATCANVLDEYPPAPDADPMDALVENIVAAAPTEVCLVLDDVHVVDDASVIDALIARLPTNGHVLLSGRRLPPVTTARLDGSSQLVRITQRDLLLSDDELAEFARARGVDVRTLAAAERWPVFVELAARGGSLSPRSFLHEEVLPALGRDRRRAIAAFAFVGGGDDELAREVTGMGLDAVLADIPLVRWTGDRAELHDLWIELLAHELSEDDRADVAARAARQHRARGDHDRAIDLHAGLERWDRMIDEVGIAIRIGVDGGLTERQLVRWLTLLPADYDRHPVVALARGVVERERDPTAAVTSEHLQSAADAFRDLGDDEMELVALLQLGYVLRVGRDPGAIVPVTARIDELAERYGRARPFRAFGAAWAALLSNDKEAQLDAVRRIEHVDLPPVWAASRDHLIANALFWLGRADEAVDYAPDVEALRIPVPGALISRSQSLWYAGRPIDAMSSPMGASRRHGARDRMIGAAWIALMRAWSGDLAGARASRAVAEQHAGDLPATITLVQLAGVDLVTQIATGDDERAAAALGAMLELSPLGSGPLDVTLHTFMALPYVLAPDTRDHWDAKPAGPSIARTRRAASAFVRARDGDPTELADINWSDPAALAVSLPVTWAVEFALLAIEGGQAIGGRRLLSWLCENWGEPARAELRRRTGDPRLADVAHDSLAQIPMPPGAPVAVSLLGETRLSFDSYPADDPNWRRERVRALLVWLIVHRRGVRDELAGALWPDLPPDRAARNLRTTLNYLHNVLEPDRTPGAATWFVRVDGPSVSLDDSLDVDLWRLTALLDEADGAEKIGRVTDALPSLMAAVDLYHGDIAPDLDAPWLELERIHVRSRVVRAACRAAELLVSTRHPDRAIEIAQRAVTVDVFHEPSYAVLVAAYEHLGDLSSAREVRRRAAERLGEIRAETGLDSLTPR